MRLRLSRLALVFAIFLGARFSVSAQPRVIYSQEAESEFAAAVEAYKAGRLEESVELLEQLASREPEHQRSSAANILLAKAYFRLNRIDESLAVLERFLKNFPHSRYVPYAEYLRGACYVRLGDSSRAVLSLVSAAAAGDSLLSQQAFAKLVGLLAGFDEMAVAKVERRVRGEREVDTLALALMEAALRRGALSEVIRRANDLLEESKSPEVRARAEELASVARRLQRGNMRVGIILPLTGYFAEQGKSLLRGIEFALKRNRPEGLQLDLVVRDSESSLLRAINEAQEMTLDERVVALIGELESDKSIAIGAIASSRKVPILVPVSSTTGVASVGNYVFQMNADLERRGRILAEYAMQELGYRTFATLAPADDYGIAMTDAFTERIDELGGTIVAQKWYYESPQDLSRQFKSMRELGFLRFIADTLAASDSTMEVPPKEMVEAVWKALNDTLRANAKPGEPTNLVDDESIPVYGIDAVFFPIYSEDIPYVAAQFAFYNIRAHPLGGSYWYVPDVLRDNQRYVNGLVIVSDWYLDENDPVYRRFRDDFRLAMGASPDRWAAYGYDAMSLLLKAMKDGATTREELKEKLENFEKVQGIRGVTTFRGNRRVNAEVNILQYVNGRFTRLR